MLKTVSTLFAALIAAWVFVGSAAPAKAETTHVYRVIHVNKYVTRYHDVWRTRYVYRVHRIVHVTLIRPIIHVHVVTRIHYRTVAAIHNVNVWVTRWLPARKYVTHSVVHVWHW
jgi:hypothetical protein